MINPQSHDFLTRFARAYPRRTISTIGLLIVAGVFEGVGISALLPALSLGIDPAAGIQDGVGPDAISRAVYGLLSTIGIAPTFPALLALVVVAIFLKAGFRWLAMRQVGFGVANVARDLRERLVRALMNVRWSYFTSQPSGFFTNAMSTETQRAAVAYRRGCTALAGVVQIPIYAGLILAISWKIGLASLLLGGLAATALSSFVGMGRAAGGDQTRSMKSLLSGLTDALQSVKPIKAMGREEKFEALVGGDIHALQTAERRMVTADESLRSFQEPLLIVIIAAGLYGAVTFGGLAFTEVLVIAFLFHRLAGRFHFVQVEYESMAAGESAYWSLESLIADAEQMAERVTGSQPAPRLERSLVAEAVSFSYGPRAILNDISFEIPAGAFVALLGPSGVGKTTILDLVSGLHQPTSGRVLIDGVDLVDVDMRSWRRQIGYVPQDSVLFHDTVLRNVWIRSGDVQEAEVRRALEQADASTFVDQMPEGLHTVLGERGAKVSGGQRQRIALARALIGNPRILLLDEATTGLDTRTEAAILETLGKLRGDVTILAVSHHDAVRGVADVAYQVDQHSISKVPIRGDTALVSS